MDVGCGSAGAASFARLAILPGERRPTPTLPRVSMTIVEGCRDFRRRLEPYRRGFLGRTTDRAPPRHDNAFRQSRIDYAVHRPFRPIYNQTSTSSLFYVYV